MIDLYPNELFSSPHWAEVLRRAYGYEVKQTSSSLPFVVLDDLAGRRALGLPFADYLPIDTAVDYLKFRDEVASEYPDLPIIARTRIPEAEVPLGETIVSRAVYHRYFPGGDARNDFKWGVRRANREGMAVREEHDIAARERFLNLYHAQRIHKFKSIPQPPSFFAAVHDVFIARGQGCYLEAWTKEGVHAATLVILRAGQGLFYKFGASHPDHLKNRPNNLLLQHQIDLVENGEAGFLDFGRSGASEAYAGLRKFKDGTGAQQHQIHYLANRPDIHSPSNKAFKRFLGGLTDELVAMNPSRNVINPFSERLYHFFA